jgi:hypothetical protein
VVTTANGVNVDFADAEGAIGTQHYAFLVSEPEFDAVFGRVRGRLLRTMDRGNWRRMPTLTASPGAMASRLQGTVPLRGMDASHSTQPCGGPEAAAG